MQKILKFQQSLDYYLKLLDTRLAQNDYLGALDSARNALTQSKTRIDKQAINILIGQIYFEMKLYLLSCEYFFRAIKVPETRAGAYFGIGRNLVMLKREKLALEYFDCALSTGGVEDFSSAVLEWTQIIRQNLSKNSVNLSSLAIAKNLVKLKQFDEALSILEPRMNAGEIEAKIMYADILIIRGEFEVAREILFKVLKDEPENVSALLVLCSLCSAQKDYCNLEINLEKLEYCELQSGQAILLATLFANLGKYNKTLKIFEKILKNDEFNTKILLFMAICSYNLGEKQDALYYVGRARWIDIENPVLNVYYDIFNRDLCEPPLKLLVQIPTKIGENKLNSVFLAVNSGNFCENFTNSLTLADDIEWCFSLKNNAITEDISKVFAHCKKKQATSLYEKLLLTIRLSKEQKYYLTKYALLAGHLKTIDITANLHFRSFKLKIPKYIENNLLIKKGYCQAVSFAEINSLQFDFEYINKRIAQSDWTANIDLKVDENLISCLYFCQNAQVLEQACIYFATDKHQVMQAINYLKLL